MVDGGRKTSPGLMSSCTVCGSDGGNKSTLLWLWNYFWLNVN